MAKSRYKLQLRNEIAYLAGLYETLDDIKLFDEVKNRIDMLIWKRARKLHLFSAMRCTDVDR